MKIQEAKAVIKERTEDILSKSLERAARKSGGRLGFICPICGHGARDEGLVFVPHDKTGGAEQLHCFACDFSGDIIDLRQQQLRAGFRTALESLAFDAGISLEWSNEDEDRTQRPKKRPLTQYWRPYGTTYPLQGETPTAAKFEGETGTPQIPPVGVEGKPEETTAKPEPEDFSEYYAKCRAQLHDQRAVEYLEGRGLDLAYCRALGLGFDPEADPAKSGNKSARIIVPTSRTHFVGRAIDPKTPKAVQKLNPKGSTPDIFNKSVLACGGVIFVTEGWADAIAIIQTGGAAVAINSTSNLDLLPKAFAEVQTLPQCVVLTMDADGAGAKAIPRLREGLEALKIPFYTADICGDYKDPAEWLEHDPEGLKKRVAEAISRARRPDSTSAYISDGYPAALKVTGKPIKTGFAEIDKENGGLYPGLYILGATSSLGKTTWALQLADQIAGTRKDVLYFATEQGRRELVSKSIARTAEIINPGTQLTALKIQTDPDSRNEEFFAAQAAYKSGVRDFLSIIEGGFGLTPAAIRARIEAYIARAGEIPVVIIDYLQVLKSGADKRPDRRTEIDEILTQIKLISQDFATPVLLISSLNRAGYSKAIDFEAFKESGGIEYTADVIWGMQVSILTNTKEAALTPQAIWAAKKEIPREVDIICLKNRFGKLDDPYSFDYNPVHDLFKEKWEGNYYKTTF